MADGVAITAGSGTTVATDDCGAAGHAQVTKLAIATDGSATLIPADATNGLDVDVTRLPKGTATLTNPTCDTTADLLIAANTSRKSVTIQNTGSVAFRVGGSGVTSSTGLLLNPGDSMEDRDSTSAWYGITASGTANAAVCEVA